MDKKEITDKLKPIVERPLDCGLEVYLVTKSEPRLKHLAMPRTGLHEDLKQEIEAVLQERYLSEDAVYAGAEDVADNQVKLYIIPQQEAYRPFDINNWTSEEFSEKHLDDCMGFIFRCQYDDQEIWCYQNKRSNTVTNRKKSNILARFLRYENGWQWEKQAEPIVQFAHAIDILIVDGYLITSDIKLLERSFDFQAFIHHKAKEAAARVAETHLFSGMDKLNDYLSSDAKSHRSYRKKMLKAMDSPVLEMTPKLLLEKISTLPRWKGKFRSPVDGKIPIEYGKEIEAMIDLLAERFTVSPVTGQEYDTEVKKKAEAVES